MTSNPYRKPWMSDDQSECHEFLADIFYGFHHINGKIKPFGSGLKINLYSSKMGTYDFDGLTRAVVLAHDRMIRVEIVPSGPQMIGMTLFKRHTREGRLHKRHPTIEEAIATHRGKP